MFDRVAVKTRAKSLIRTGNPAAWKVTLIYLLATSCILSIVESFSPIGRANDVLDTMQQMILSGGYIPESTMNALVQEMLSSFQGVGATIALLITILVALYTLVVNLGFTSYVLARMRDEDRGTGELFSQFGLAAKVILMEILMFIFIYLWSLLFVIPGIIAAYRYRMAPYILLEDPDISALEAIRRSKQMMQGKKGTLFVMDLSFFGWLLLAGVVSGVLGGIVGGIVGKGIAFTIFNLVIATAINMFLVCYYRLTEAGFYLWALGNEAPPVQERSFDPYAGIDDDSGDGDSWIS